jgi:hypothetical protein
MTPLSEEDPLLNDLSRLPAVPLDPAVADAVRRSARAALVEPAAAATPLDRLSLAWSGSLLPGLLLASGAAYTWGAVRMLGQIFVGG